jgi:hypothetical protein
VSALTNAYRLLGLQPDLLFRRLHQQSLADGDAVGAPGRDPRSGDGPVIVRRGRAGPSGHSLPRIPPAAARDTAAISKPPAEATVPDARLRDVRPSDVPPSDVRPSDVRLSQAVVTRTMAETEAVSALLTGIFTDDGPTAADGAGPGSGRSAGAQGPAGAHGPTGLDGVHSRLLRELGTRSSWSRADLAELAAGHGVLPSGALDVINEVAMEIAGEPVIEGDDELRINHDVLREVFG